MKNKNEEIEVAFTNINVRDIENRLKKMGANKVSDIFYKMDIFDYPDFSLNKKGAWIRLRDNGKTLKLAFKQRLGIGKGKNDNEDLGMKEIEMEILDFEKTKDFLLSIGLIEKNYTEKKRIRWKKGDVNFDIDTYPVINPFVEIESDNMEKIDKAIKELGLDLKDKRVINVWEIYKENGYDLLKYNQISFDKGLVEKGK